jgi:hypothetical protein
MSNRLLWAAAVIAALWSAPAAAPVLCPDATGTYTPDACDLILPIEPNPRAVDCDLIEYVRWLTTKQSDAPAVCVEYWEREAEKEARLRAMLLGSPI